MAFLNCKQMVYVFILSITLVEVTLTEEVVFKDDKADNGIAKDYSETYGDCSSFKNNLPDGCTASFDCSTITCNTEFVDKSVVLTFDINKCEKPVTVTVTVQIYDLGIDWSHTFSSTENIGIPGFSVSFGLFTVGVLLEVDLTPDNDDIMEMKVNLLVGAGEVHVTPLTVMDVKLPISTDECGIVRWWKGLSTILQIVIVGGSGIILISIAIACCCGCCTRRYPGNVIVGGGAPNPNIMVTTNSKVPMRQFVNEI